MGGSLERGVSLEVSKLSQGSETNTLTGKSEIDLAKELVRNIIRSKKEESRHLNWSEIYTNYSAFSKNRNL